jgi:hypothetical protein
MEEQRSLHLSNDEVDAWLDGSLSQPRRAHIDTCFPCRTLTRAERVLVRRLEAMGRFEPSPGFVDRVMDQVALPDPFALRATRRLWDRVHASRRTLAIAASLMVVLGLSMGGSVAWSLSHSETLTAWGSWLATQAGNWFWLGLRGVVSNLIEHPWYYALRDMVGTPERIAIVSAVNMVIYVGGLLLLKRLLALPGQRVAHARP